MAGDSLAAQARARGLSPSTVRRRAAAGVTGSRLFEPPATRAQRNAERKKRPKPLSHPWKQGPRSK